MKKTELQWAKEGFVINECAKGELEWINGYHQARVIRFSEDEVHTDIKKAKEIIRQKNRQYRENRKKKEQKWNEFVEERMKWHTEYQWLQEGRIPNVNARWKNGNDLNYLYSYVCDHSFGSNYYYCYISDTHIPINSRELEEALKDCDRRYQEKRAELEKQYELYEQNRISMEVAYEDNKTEN